jgi:hypothetical protein
LSAARRSIFADGVSRCVGNPLSRDVEIIWRHALGGFPRKCRVPLLVCQQLDARLDPARRLQFTDITVLAIHDELSGGSCVRRDDRWHSGQTGLIGHDAPRIP